MYLYGAGGHAKVIRDILEANGIIFSGIIDDNPKEKSFMEQEIKHSLDGVGEVIISIGSNKKRKLLSERLFKRGIIFGTAIHPSAILSKYAKVEEGTVVMQGAIIQSCTHIGKHCIINSGASIDHDNEIEDYVHISPHATLCGEVTVGEGTWIGAGTVLKQCTKIGKWSVIGAGSVVVSDIPDGVLAYGNPCRVVRLINDDIK
ncbi:MAG: acetyltransferase [Phocaeicola sp.]|uniref:acetyltransferase n=1 Tax=Phocaeicola TaxID=909656 RepID=UPI00234F3665|nr:acetyltransferase [Phocaeicola oris]MCE2617187.1 acetyltransferase [Phocaeicola oris]